MESVIIRGIHELLGTMPVSEQMKDGSELGN